MNSLYFGEHFHLIFHTSIKIEKSWVRLFIWEVWEFMHDFCLFQIFRLTKSLWIDLLLLLKLQFLKYIRWQNASISVILGRLVVQITLIDLHSLHILILHKTKYQCSLLLVQNYPLFINIKYYLNKFIIQLKK